MFEAASPAETRECISILARSLNSPQVPSTFPQLPHVISASPTRGVHPHRGLHMRAHEMHSHSDALPSRAFLKEGKGRGTQSIRDWCTASFWVQHCFVATGPLENFDRAGRPFPMLYAFRARFGRP